MEKSKGKIQVGIYTIAILMMGVVGIASSLSVIGSHFPDLSQTEVQSLISIPCIVIIPVTLLVGALMKTMSKKLLSLIGVVLFLIGGVGPAFSESFLVIQILRGIFGAGVGILQVVSTALVAENFEGAMRDKVQGQPPGLPRCLGCAIMVFVGGWMATLSWNGVFYVHLIAVITLVCVIACLPNVQARCRREGERSACRKGQAHRQDVGMDGRGVLCVLHGPDLFQRQRLPAR